MIYISTSSFKNTTAYNAATLLKNKNITNIELSGGRYDQNYISNLLTLKGKCNFMIHNYFPPPETPFVFNLASFNLKVVDKSLNLAYKAIKLANLLGSKFVSLHAGFLFDPQVSELGKTINRSNLQDRNKSKALFISRINQIATYAKKDKIRILLENNVFSYANKKTFSINPFLMVDCEESLEILNKTNDNVGLLVDLGHLNVSSQTEGFCRFEFLNSTNKFIGGYHLSDNDRFSDSNGLICEDTWFWSHINKHVSYYSLEVNSSDFDILQNQINLISSKLLN